MGNMSKTGGIGCRCQRSKADLVDVVCGSIYQPPAPVEYRLRASRRCSFWHLPSAI